MSKSGNIALTSYMWISTFSVSGNRLDIGHVGEVILSQQCSNTIVYCWSFSAKTYPIRSDTLCEAIGVWLYRISQNRLHQGTLTMTKRREKKRKSVIKFVAIFLYFSIMSSIITLCLTSRLNMMSHAVDCIKMSNHTTCMFCCDSIYYTIQYQGRIQNFQLGGR